MGNAKSKDNKSQATSTKEGAVGDNGDESKENVPFDSGKNATEIPSDILVGERPELTDEQKAVLQETWKVLEDNVAKVGVITFTKLFETHPDVKESFMPFNGIEVEELKHSKQLRAHALRVMGFVQKAIARLHEPEKLDNLLKELGKNHYYYGAKRDYIDLVGPQFILAIRPSLEDRWTEELQETWIQLFRFMGYVMKETMLSNEQQNRSGDSATAEVQKPDSSK